MAATALAGPQPERFQAGEKFRHQAPVVAPGHVLINALILVTKCDAVPASPRSGRRTTVECSRCLSFRSPQLVITVHCRTHPAAGYLTLTQTLFSCVTSRMTAKPISRP